MNSLSPSIPGTSVPTVLHAPPIVQEPNDKAMEAGDLSFPLEDRLLSACGCAPCAGVQYSVGTERCPTNMVKPMSDRLSSKVLRDDLIKTNLNVQGNEGYGTLLPATWFVSELCCHLGPLFSGLPYSLCPKRVYSSLHSVRTRPLGPSGPGTIPLERIPRHCLVPRLTLLSPGSTLPQTSSHHSVSALKGPQAEVA